MLKRHSAPSLLQQQAPLLILILILMIVAVAQTILGERWYAAGMVVPREIEIAAAELCDGNFSMASIAPLLTLFTSAFLHGSAEHLLGNCIFLWIFAALINELMGPRWMLATFLITAAAGALVHTLLNRHSPVPMLGASGAVMGMEGTYLGLALRYVLPDPHIWPMSHSIPPLRLAAVGVFGFFLDYHAVIADSPEHIAYGAHLGGFACGLALATLLMPLPRHARRLVSNSF